MLKPTLLAGALCLSVAASPQADISYSQHITVDASGGMAMFSSEGTALTQISDDKARIDNNFEMKSGLARAFAGSGESGSIVRLDRNLLWNLSPGERRYEEQTIAELRAQREQLAQSMQQSQAGGQGLPVSAEECRWSDSEVEFERPQGEERVAGFKTSRALVRLHQSCRDAQTGNTCEMTWTMENWLARNLPGEKEATAFQQAWAEALGLGDAAAAMEGPAAGLVGMFGANWDEVADELGQMRGYPLRTVMEMEIGGEHCKTASGTAIAMDEMWSDASTAAYNAALDQSGREAGRAAGAAARESLGNSAAGNIGSSAIGAATGELIGGLTGMFKKKKEPPQARTQDPATVPRVRVFRITSEVTDWRETSIPQERFDEPENWTKM